MDAGKAWKVLKHEVWWSQKHEATLWLSSSVVVPYKESQSALKMFLILCLYTNNPSETFKNCSSRGTLLCLTLERVPSPPSLSDLYGVLALDAVSWDYGKNTRSAYIWHHSQAFLDSAFVVCILQKQNQRRKEEIKTSSREGLVVKLSTSVWLQDNGPELVAHLVCLSIHKLLLERLLWRE